MVAAALILSLCDAKSLFRVASVSTRLPRTVLGAIQLKITGTLKQLIGGPNTAWLDRLTLEKFEMEHAVVRLKTSRLGRLYYRAPRAEAIWSIEGGHELRVSPSGGRGGLFAPTGAGPAQTGAPAPTLLSGDEGGGHLEHRGRSRTRSLNLRGHR